MATPSNQTATDDVNILFCLCLRLLKNTFEPSMKEMRELADTVIKTVNEMGELDSKPEQCTVAISDIQKACTTANNMLHELDDINMQEAIDGLKEQPSNFKPLERLLEKIRKSSLAASNYYKELQSDCERASRSCETAAEACKESAEKIEEMAEEKKKAEEKEKSVLAMGKNAVFNVAGGLGFGLGMGAGALLYAGGAVVPGVGGAALKGAGGAVMQGAVGAVVQGAGVAVSAAVLEKIAKTLLENAKSFQLLFSKSHQLNELATKSYQNIHEAETVLGDIVAYQENYNESRENIKEHVKEGEVPIDTSSQEDTKKPVIPTDMPSKKEQEKLDKEIPADTSPQNENKGRKIWMPGFLDIKPTLPLTVATVLTRPQF